MGAQPADVTRERALALHARAVEANAAAKPQRALQLIREAFRTLGVSDEDAALAALDPDGRVVAARLLITAAKSESDLHGLRPGLATLERAERLVRRLPDRTVATIARVQRGFLYTRYGDNEKALAEFTAVDPTLTTMPVQQQCNLLLSRGIVRINLLQLGPARADFTRCIDLARGADLRVHIGMAMHNLGYVDFLAGDLVSALDEMTEAIRRYEGLPVAISALDRARVLGEAGLTREADLAFDEAAVMFARERCSLDLAEVELERARTALVAGDVAGARRLSGRARDRYRRVGGVPGRRNAELVLLQGDLAAGRPGRRLLGPALRLREEFDEAGLRLQARTAALIAAEAALRAGEIELAGQILAAAGSVGRSDPITARVQARHVRAQWELARGRPGVAARIARTGLTELDAHRSRFGSIDLQTAAAVHGRRLAELDVAIALRSGRADTVLAAAERARASSSRTQLVRPPADRDVVALLAQLRQVNELLRASSSDAAASGPLHARRRALERDIAERGWTREGTGEIRGVADQSQVIDALGDRVLACYVQAGDDLHAVVVVDGRMRLASLGAAERVTEQVRRLRADLDVLAQEFVPVPIRAAVAASARRSAELLDELLVRPLDIADRRLVVVTTGTFGQLPWASLPSLSAVPLVVAPSATAWLASSGSRRRRVRAVTAVAGPDVAHGPREVAGVAALWPESSALAGADAHGRAFRQALAGSAVLHVAAHGLHNTDNALFSSLRLADGMVFAHELDAAGRVPDHVILSACELGLADVRPGDEALGLTSVLLRLGTRSVVSSVARVNDEVAAETMIDYHRLLAAGADSAEALATAVAKADGFAPFVCFGSSWSAPPARPAVHPR